MKTVLISGSESGMGLLTAQTLIQQGYAVYAGVRDPHGRSTARKEVLGRFAADQPITVPSQSTASPMRKRSGSSRSWASSVS